MPYYYVHPTHEQGGTDFPGLFEEYPQKCMRDAFFRDLIRMKQIKLTGRERSVLRVLDFAAGNTGDELLESSRLEADDLVSVLSGLMGPGYIEMSPYAEEATLETFQLARFDINPSYAGEIRAAMAQRY